MINRLASRTILLPSQLIQTPIAITPTLQHNSPIPNPTLALALALTIHLPINPPIHPLNSLIHPISYKLSTDNKYKQKTTKQIEHEIAQQKWKQLQNTFKSLQTSFGLKKPTQKQLEITKYAKPDKIQYDLAHLRQCSHSYPVYLYRELEKKGSPFCQVIDKVLENLWKAEEKETLEFMEFIYMWEYKWIDVKELHQIVIARFDLNMGQLFTLLKRYNGQLHHQIQIKVIQRLNMQNLLSNQYGDLLKIVNYFTIKQILSQQFFIATTQSMYRNINKIPPASALEAYIFFTYNIQQHLDALNKYSENKKIKQEGNLNNNKENVKGGGKQEQEKGKDKGKQKLEKEDKQGKQEKQGKQGEQGRQEKKVEKQDLGFNIVKLIQKRIISPECLKFYNGDQFVALLHTFLKNNMILSDQTKTEAYHQNIQKILSRIQLNYFTQDFSEKNKENLLQLSPLLPQLKKQTTIALVQQEYLKKSQNFPTSLLTPLYLLSYENNFLTKQLKQKLQGSIISNIFLLKKKDIARVLWLMTINQAKNLNIMHKKIQEIVLGGLNGFTVEEISIFVWSMSVARFREDAGFWGNLEAFLKEELQRGIKRKQKIAENKQTSKDNAKQSIIKENDEQGQLKQTKSPDNKRLTTNVSWILWAYHNNRQLSLQTLSLIIQSILLQYPPTPSPTSPTSPPPPPMSPFQLTNITTYFYSISYPSQTITSYINKIILEQFKQIYITMQSIELCKCLKYIGKYVWKKNNQYFGEHVKDNILMIFQMESQKIGYRDIMTVVAVLLDSGVKTGRVAGLVRKLMERKRRLESLEGYQEKTAQNKGKKVDKQRWKFPI